MFPERQTTRLLLQQILPEDQSFIFEGLSHPQVIPYYGVQYRTLEETREQMVYYHQLWLSGRGMWWKLVDKNTGQKVGAAGFNDYNTQHQKCEVGYWLLPQYWGTGLATEALRSVVEFLFKEKKAHRIEALIEQANAGSCRVMERIGFIREGLLRDYEQKNSRYISLYIYSLLASDAVCQ